MRTPTTKLYFLVPLMVTSISLSASALKADEQLELTPEKETAKLLGSGPSVDILTNSIGIKLKLIPAGEFMMGSPADEANRDDDETRHKVRITNPYYIGITEVTQGHWFAVMKTKPWDDGVYVKEGDDYPATYVTWENAVEYCKTLSGMEGRTYRLPTEAEWEYACRAGTSTTFSCGADASALKTYAWFTKNADDVGEQYAHAVGTKQANPFGLYDMHGNVNEWCADWKGDYDSSTVVNPIGPSRGYHRVNRGGSWRYSANFCRSAWRSSAVPFGLHNTLGFRLALSLSAP